MACRPVVSVAPFSLGPSFFCSCLAHSALATQASCWSSHIPGDLRDFALMVPYLNPLPSYCCRPDALTSFRPSPMYPLLGVALPSLIFSFPALHPHPKPSALSLTLYPHLTYALLHLSMSLIFVSSAGLQALYEGRAAVCLVHYGTPWYTAST